MKFEIDDLIRLAKRENNTKRPYLYVNLLQGKHVPVSPSCALEMFSLLAKKVERRYQGESILAIGFAETATAIGSSIAYEAANVTCYMNTTREDVSQTGYLFFTESHSHATEQRLALDRLDDFIAGVDRILFVEDEVTTGNTIEKLIHVLKERYPKRAMAFGIISILNSMSDSRLLDLKAQGIDWDCLYRIPSGYRVGDIEQYIYEKPEPMVDITPQILVKGRSIGGYWNCRLVCSTEEIREKCKGFLETINRQITMPDGPCQILVLGTEEFMFPAMLFGHALEQTVPEAKVRFHATTRSPIEVSLNQTYPLHQRVALDSFYEAERKTFLYNLVAYDRAVIVTDAAEINRRGLDGLVCALERAGTTDVTWIKWGHFNEE